MSIYSLNTPSATFFMTSVVLLLGYMSQAAPVRLFSEAIITNMNVVVFYMLSFELSFFILADISRILNKRYSTWRELILNMVYLGLVYRGISET